MSFEDRMKRHFDELDAVIKRLDRGALDRDPGPGLPVAIRSLFPRSIVGKYQDDPIMRSILMAARGRPFSELSQVDIMAMISRLMDPTIGFVRRYFEAFSPRASEFFQLAAERLRHLETYRPTAGDFAVEALQNAFVGFRQNGATTTRGKVIEIAKARLKQSGGKSDFSKAYWSELLQTAGFGDWLPEGRPGRPSKASLDENVRAEREYKSLCTQAIKDFHGGDPRRARDSLKAAFGNRSEYHRSEEERLREHHTGSDEEEL
jgi:hypothetical protein